MLLFSFNSFRTVDFVASLDFNNTKTPLVNTREQLYTRASSRLVSAAISICSFAKTIRYILQAVTSCAN